MKKIFALLLTVSTASLGFTQNSNFKTSSSVQNTYSRNNSNLRSNYGKTALSFSRGFEPIDTTYVLYPNNYITGASCTDTTEAYVFGANYYQERKKGQYYSINLNNYDSAEINGVWADVYVYKNANSTASITAQVYEFDTAQGIPTNLLGTSVPVLLTALSSTPFHNFAFNSPVSVPDHGFVVVSVSTPTTAGDTTILFSTPVGCTDDLLNAWEYFPSGGTNYWAPITWTWGNGQGLNGPAVDFHIFPEVSFYSTVYVNSSDAELLTFGFQGLNPVATGIIGDSTVIVKVPAGTSITNLAATFTVSGAASLWKDNSVQVSGQTSNNFTNPVTYYVKAEDGSTKNYTVEIDELSSIETNVISNLFIAPNPVNDLLSLSFNATQAYVSIKLMNIRCQLIYSEMISNMSGTFRTSIDLNNINSGIYFLQINTNEGMLIKKVLKN